MYTKTQKQKILNYLKKHSQSETCKLFGIHPDTLKYWQNEEYKKAVQEKEKGKYLPVNRVKRKYTKGNAEAQRISAQIKRAIKRIPKINYNKEEMASELEAIKKKKGSLQCSATTNKTILTYQQHFFDKERELFANPKIARKLIKNRMKYLFKEPKYLTDQEILRGFKISGEFYGYSHFAPEWFKWFIEYTQCSSVLDPCGGWGHRLLGIIGTNIKKYIYNDFDERTYINCKKMSQDWSNYFTCNLEFYNQRAELLDVSNMKYDSIFTCPPYYNKEIYNNKTFKNIEDFSNWWSKVVVNTVKSEVKSIGIVIDTENIDIIATPILNCGYKLVENQPIKVKKSHFTSGTTKDNILIFQNNE